MPRLTITTEEELLRWVRRRAAQRNMSVARLVGELLKEHMQEKRGYENAKRRFLGTKARAFSQGAYPSRDELHDRPRLR